MKRELSVCGLLGTVWNHVEGSEDQTPGGKAIREGVPGKGARAEGGGSAPRGAGR